MYTYFPPGTFHESPQEGFGEKSHNTVFVASSINQYFLWLPYRNRLPQNENSIIMSSHSH